MSLWPDILDALDGVTRQRVAWLTCAGTWAAPGTGYPSWIIQNADDGLVFEVPVQAPWSFGPVSAPDPNSPSYNESVAIGKAWAIGWLRSWPGLWGLAGYSQGGQCASEVFEETYPGGQLAHMADRFVGGVTLGDPMRPTGVTGGGMPDPGGSGISPKRVTHPHPNWHYHANGRANGAPGPDLYTATPNDNAGAIIRTFYGIGVNIGLSHPDVMLLAIVKGMLELFTELAGINTTAATTTAPSGGILGALGNLIPGLGGGGSILGALAPIAASALPAVTGPLAVLGPLAALAGPILGNNAIPSLLGGGGLGAITGLLGGIAIGDAIEAAIFALQFLFEGTGPHITYDTTDAIPGSGINHIAHAVGHVNEISAAAIRA